MDLIQLDIFAYMNYFINKAIAGETWGIDEINQVGTRKSGKDESVKTLAFLSMLKIRDFALMGVMKTIKSSNEL